MSEVFWSAWTAIAFVVAVVSAIVTWINVDNYHYEHLRSQAVAAFVCGVIALASTLSIPWLLELSARATQP